MATPGALDRIHHLILEAFVATGHAPGLAALAAGLGVEPAAARGLLHELVATGLPVWLQPGAETIASCAPFNEVPTPYRASVDGQPGWFAQCGFEALALTWVFPGRTVRIDAPCPHCGEPLRVDVRDGVLARVEPEGAVCYVDLPFREWARSWPDT
jgi:hypothetical protein